MPKKLLRIIDPESSQKSKISYRNSQRKFVNTEPILLNLEEYEAVRLYHYKKLPQSECAEMICVSQPTFSRILRSGLEKLAQALVEDKDFEIIGGHVSYEDWFAWACWECDNEWQTEPGPLPKLCPKYQATSVYKLKKMVTHFS